MEGRKCTKCKTLYFPIRQHCAKCMDDSMERYIFDTKGKIVEFTRIEEAPQGFELMVPYNYGIVELDEGVRISCQIIDSYSKELEVGMPVEMTFRLLRKSEDQGILQYGFKALPIE